MQYATAHVRLGGNINNEIFKAGVTPAEVLLLQHIHGTDAVVKIRPRGNDKRAHVQEVERLQAEYGEGAFKQVFPGAMPQLPVTFRDVGIDVNGDDSDTPSAATAPRKPRVSKQVETTGDSEQAGQAGETGVEE